MIGTRRATEDDTEAIARLELECFPDDAWVEAYLKVAVTGGMETIRVLVADVSAETGASRTVVGHAIVSVVHEVAELQRVGVAESSRRGGVGTRLLTAALDLARDEGAERLLLEVREANDAARTFYAAQGFDEIDRRERYYRDGSTAIILQKHLDPS